MEGDQADERWLALPDPARARWRSPHARRTKGSALMEVLTTARNVLVARRPPSGTSVLRPPATPWRQPQHPRSSAPRQSRSRTVYNSLAVPLGGGLAISMLLAHTDPNAACISSSQPLLLECCEDRLNPPWIIRSSRTMTATMWSSSAKSDDPVLSGVSFYRWSHGVLDAPPSRGMTVELIIHAHQIQPVRRRDGAAGGAVAGGECGGKIVGTPAAFADPDQ